MHYYSNYILAAAIFGPLHALVGMMTARITGFKARYLAVLSSTMIGYALCILAGVIAGFALPSRPTLLMRFIAGFCCMTVAHAIILKSREDERLGLPKAIVVALGQLGFGFAVVMAVDHWLIS
jgi:hypothetical protein